MGASCTCQRGDQHMEFVNDSGEQVIATQNKAQVEEKQADQDEVHQTEHDQQEEEHDKEEIDPIQLESYEWEDNKPSANYARPLLAEEEANFQMEETVRNTHKKNQQQVIKAKLSHNYKRIPHTDQPYIILETRDIYVGQWARGKPFGIGCIYYFEGGIYEGQVVDSKPDGDGMRIWKDGSLYIGQFQQGIMGGKGKLKKNNKFFYEGGWLNGIPNGKGIEVWPNGTSYSGDYLLGKKQGRGRFQWGSQDNKGSDDKPKALEAYEGEFNDNLFDGEGIYEWPDGRKYEGGWRKGKMSGEGVFVWPDGKKYTGQYREDYKHGNGVFEWPDGKKIKGEWKLGKLEGIAELEYGGKTYKGEWQKGKRIKWIQEQPSAIINNSNILSMGPSEIIDNKISILDERRGTNENIFNDVSVKEKIQESKTIA